MLELPGMVKNVSIDPCLYPVDVRVFLVASQTLDDRRFMPLKLAPIAITLDLGRSCIHGALRRLCEQGYLERGPRVDGRGAVTYRLPPHLVALG